MAELERELTQLIIETLAIENMDAAQTDPEATLFGGGWGLDSVDALELGLMLQKRYGIKIDSAASDTRAYFATVRSLAAFVAANRVS